MSLRKKLMSLSDSEYEEIFMEAFRQRFREVGARGCTIIEDDSLLLHDNSKPFFLVCRTIAEKIKTQNEFRPILITLIGSGQKRFNESISGLMIKYDSVSILLCLKGSIITLSYSWPEPYSGADRGSSHSSKDYDFDLLDPNSIESLTVTMNKRCVDMLDQWRPSDGPLSVLK
jgi:hypothetical protein